MKYNFKNGVLSYLKIFSNKISVSFLLVLLISSTAVSAATMEAPLKDYKEKLAVYDAEMQEKWEEEKRRLVADAKKPEWYTLPKNILKVSVMGMLDPIGMIVDDAAKQYPEDKAFQGKLEFFKFATFVLSAQTGIKQAIATYLTSLGKDKSLQNQAFEVAFYSLEMTVSKAQGIMDGYSSGSTNKANTYDFSNPYGLDFSNLNLSSALIDNQFSSFSGSFPSGGYKQSSAKGGAGSDLSFTYSTITSEVAENTVGDYGSVPGGVVLEGLAMGLEPIGKLQNAKLVSDPALLIINDKHLYFTHLPRKQAREILNSLREDNRLGVSLGSKNVVFGELKRQGNVAVNLFLADEFLGGLTFHRLEKFGLDKYKHPNFFEIQRWSGDHSRSAVFFKFQDFAFQVNGNQIVSSKAQIQSYLIPISKNKRFNGKHKPDLSRINNLSGAEKSGFKENLQHVERNFAYYSKERIIRIAKMYGEFASIVRALQKEKVKIKEVN